MNHETRQREMARVKQVGHLPGSVDSVVLEQLFEAHGASRFADRHFETGSSTGAGSDDMASGDLRREGQHVAKPLRRV
jgi:hypothetical protein